MDNNNIERELDWDSEINKESEFTLLPEGDYNFTVVSFERARHQGSAKLPPCNKAIVKIKIDGGELGSTTIQHNLFLHTKCEGMLSEFFIALGLKKHGEKLAMNWNAVQGKTGRCKVYIHEMMAQRGSQTRSNASLNLLSSPHPLHRRGRQEIKVVGNGTAPISAGGKGFCFS